ncbi:hypothetical protein OG394_12080 [Kribbella sp. NBC_01245]|uniref:RHS repeat protein n=1 Tax=Kribbella sp. NBC_01245 TaxID=2903578 RepID=UPI002E2CCA54|nr:RHS repeat-associated core domain-containing protein [Kribbella sp. NBC_01245]
MVYTNDSRLRWITKSGSSPGAYEGYSYDAAGNVNFQRRGAADTWYKYDRNRLLCAGTTSTDPCAAGSANYNYDAFGRLDTVTSNDKLVERYGYDGFDRVVSHRKYDPATGALKSGQTTAFDPLDRTTQESTQVGTGTAKTTTFTHLGMSDQIISEEQPDPGAGGVAKTTATYTYGPGGERISQTTSPLAGGASETSYYGVNPHTDVETLTSESGNTRSTYRYTGYGENDGAGFSGKDKATATGGPEVEAYNPYRFNSKRWDPATGGYDMGFRDYSPGLNRFLTRDMYNGALSDLRLGSDPWTGNRYAFAGGNPITGIEYDGHCPMADEGGCDTNANYEIYVPPASTGGTETGDQVSENVGVTRVIAPDGETYLKAKGLASEEFERRGWNTGQTPGWETCKSVDQLLGGNSTCGGGLLMHATEFGKTMCEQPGMTCGDTGGSIGAIMAMAGAMMFHGREGAAAKAGGALVKYDADFAIGQLTKGGRGTASGLVDVAESQGWKAVQSSGGPLKYVDSNGIERLVIKRGTARTPGSNFPHVAIRNASGQRVDPYGNVVSRKSPGNHTPITWDLP